MLAGFSSSKVSYLRKQDSREDWSSATASSYMPRSPRTLSFEAPKRCSSWLRQDSADLSSPVCKQANKSCSISLYSSNFSGESSNVDFKLVSDVSRRLRINGACCDRWRLENKSEPWIAWSSGAVRLIVWQTLVSTCIIQLEWRSVGETKAGTVYIWISRKSGETVCLGRICAYQSDTVKLKYGVIFRLHWRGTIP